MVVVVVVIVMVVSAFVDGVDGVNDLVNDDKVNGTASDDAYASQRCGCHLSGCRNASALRSNVYIGATNSMLLGSHKPAPITGALLRGTWRCCWLGTAGYTRSVSQTTTLRMGSPCRVAYEDCCRLLLLRLPIHPLRLCTYLGRFMTVAGVVACLIARFFVDAGAGASHGGSHGRAHFVVQARVPLAVPRQLEGDLCHRCASGHGAGDNHDKRFYGDVGVRQRRLALSHFPRYEARQQREA